MMEDCGRDPGSDTGITVESQSRNVCVCVFRKPPHLNEHIDIVCDLQSDHFNLVLLPKEINILNGVSREATWSSSAETLPHPSSEHPPSSPAERRAAV